MELLEIWKHVLVERPDARLGVIGSGELEGKLRRKVQDLNLRDNVTLFGFKDGEEKFGILSRSKIFVHPASYDTGAIAPMESMAYGLPGVCFDLPALRSYYPKGMIRVPPGDLKMFATAVLNLLENPTLFCRLREEAIQLSKQYSWTARSHQLLQIVQAVALPDGGLSLREISRAKAPRF
jgi:glycosyltransferase involved in cell wall biosynthesis